MPHATRRHLPQKPKRQIEKVLKPATSIFDQQQVVLTCGHTVWVSGNKDLTAYCTRCDLQRLHPPTVRRRF